MLHELTFNADFQDNIVVFKVVLCNMAHRVIFNITFWKFMMNMWFVADPKVEPNKPRSTISPDKNTADSIAEQTWKPWWSKTRGSMAEDDKNAKHAQMYEAAINFM